MAKRHTKTTACETVAKSLREFGYPDVTGSMIREVLTAFLSGKRYPDLPHYPSNHRRFRKRRSPSQSPGPFWERKG